MAFKRADGKWTSERTKFVVGQDREALTALKKLEEQFEAAAEFSEKTVTKPRPEAPGPPQEAIA